MADAFSQYDDFDALGLGELVARREVHPRELVDTAIDRIERLNGKLNVVTVRAYESARAEALRPLTGAPFDGVPFLAKDLSTSWKGLPSTNSCQYMADYVSPADSEVVRRTRLAGFITLGKTNVPENGWCLSTEPPFRGVTHNPWDETLRRRGVQRRQRSRGRCRHTADCGRVRRRGLDSCAGCG